MERKLSALEQQGADVLRRARRLPVGAERNDLRQLAMGLLWLHRNGMDALMEQRSASRPLTTPVEHERAPGDQAFGQSVSTRLETRSPLTSAELTRPVSSGRKVALSIAVGEAHE